MNLDIKFLSSKGINTVNDMAKILGLVEFLKDGSDLAHVKCQQYGKIALQLYQSRGAVV